MGRTRSVNTKKRLGKLSEVQMSKISISQNLCSAKFHFPYFSKFKFSGTQKTHFREYPFSRIPILSVVKDFELKNPFSRKPIFARIDCSWLTDWTSRHPCPTISEREVSKKQNPTVHGLIKTFFRWTESMFSKHILDAFPIFGRLEFRPTFSGNYVVYDITLVRSIFEANRCLVFIDTKSQVI